MTDVQTNPDATGADAPLLLTEVSEGIGTITFNRPDAYNLLTGPMLAALGAQLDAWRDERPVRVIVLAAHGKAFCAGHDMKDLAGATRGETERLFDRCTEMMEGIRLHPRPVIAQVQGFAAAAGCQLVAACDLAVASEQARFGTTGVKSGLFCFTPMVPLTRVVPHRKALEMLLTGDLIDAPEAERIGLVNHVVPHDALAARTRDLAARIARHSASIVAMGKAAYYRQRALDVPEAYTLAARAMVENALAPDGQEGISAFLEKRPPRYQD